MALILPRILCIDDDEDSRLMLVNLLRFEQIQAKGVETADQALSLIQSERFDLYLTDARLPKIDGFELCRRIRNFDSTTPILFFSGSAYAADKRKGIEAGANAYVIKPDIEDLLLNIKQFITLPESLTAQEIPIRREESATRFSPFGLREPLYVG